MLEIILEILWLIAAIWFVYQGYTANKKAEPFRLKDLSSTKKALEGMDSMVIANGFVLGLFMLFLLVYKLSTCGLVCGWV